MANIVTQAFNAAKIGMESAANAARLSFKAGALSDRGYNPLRRATGAFWNWDYSTVKGYQGNSLVYACVEALATAIPSAQLEVRSGPKDQAIDPHPLIELLRRPNNYYDEYEFWHLTTVYYLLGGDAYWWKGYNGSGRIVELWPLRPDLVFARQNHSAAFAAEHPGVTVGKWIDYYDYNLMGNRITIPPGDLVHFRNGHNPNNPRHGISSIAPILAEVGLDAMATEHVTALLDNYAIPGLAVTVKRRINGSAESDEIKARFMARYGGPKRGEPMVMDQDTQVAGLNVTPQQMEMPDLRDVAETRICMAFNVPPIVVGALSGLKRGTYSNYAQAREAFWDEGVNPRLMQFRAKINAQLLPDFDSRKGNLTYWDLSGIRALQEDEGAKYTRTLLAFQAGAITRNMWLEENGYDAVEDGKVYLIPTNVKEREEGLTALAAANTPPPAPVTLLPPANQTPDQLPAPDATAAKALPAPRAHKSALAAEHLGALSVRVRDTLTQGFADQIDAFFERLGKRAEFRVKQIAGIKAATLQQDATIGVFYAFTVDELTNATDWKLLADLYGAQYRTVLELMWSEINNTIADGSRFDAADPFVQDFIQRGAQQVTRVEETTKQAIRDHLSAAQRAGYGVDQIVGGVIDSATKETLLAPLRDVVSGAGLRPGIYTEEYDRRIKQGKTEAEARDLATKKASNSRAYTIARTELGFAANAGAAARFKTSGLVLAVRVYDGDGCGWKSHTDPDKANGSIRSLEEAEQYTLGHPNCQRAYGPITDPLELPKEWRARIA